MDGGTLTWQQAIRLAEEREYAGCYLAHNLMLIAYGKYGKRQPSLQAYIQVLDTLTH
jgi:hypothetical protein